MAGGLFDPLGRDRALRRKTTPISLPVAVAAVAVAALAGLIVVSYLRDDGDRGWPTIISTIDHTTAPPKPIVPITPTPPALPPSLPQAASGDDVEIQNGVRIIRPHRDRSGTGGDVIAIPNRTPADAATGH